MGDLQFNCESGGLVKLCNLYISVLDSFCSLKLINFLWVVGSVTKMEWKIQWYAVLRCQSLST